MYAQRAIPVLALALQGCFGAPALPEAAASEARVPFAARLAPPPEPAPQPLGTFHMTYYWIAHESGRKPSEVTLYNPSCKPLAKVSRSFAVKAIREGTARTRGGALLNARGPCQCATSPCFFVADEKSPWGVGVADKPLSPFRSVAVDPEVVSIGTRLYVKELDGLEMPGRSPWGNFVHDGCVTADDRGGNVRGTKIDFFTGRRRHFLDLRRHRLQQVTVLDGNDRC